MNSFILNISWESYKKSLDNLLNQYKENIDELDLRYIKTIEKNCEYIKTSNIFHITPIFDLKAFIMRENIIIFFTNFQSL